MGLISLSLKCPKCGESVMDEEKLVDNSPGVRLKIKTLKDRGFIWLSSVYESYNYVSDIEIIHGETAEFFCPHCDSSIISNQICEECNANKMHLNLEDGGRVYFCSRSGCKDHSLEFNQITSAMGHLYREYVYSGKHKYRKSQPTEKSEKKQITEKGKIDEIIQTGTFLQSYCPHCKKSLIDNNMLRLKVINGGTGELMLSPYLNVFTSKSTIFLKENTGVKDLKCFHCDESLMVEKKCEECGSPVAMISVSTCLKQIEFYICSKKGCTWHGLSDDDYYEIKLENSLEW